MMFTIQQRDVPEQLVLTEQRHVRAAELTGWISAAGGRLTRAAATHGGVAGPAFVVYYGPVSDESEVLVEMCVPLRAGNEGASDAAMRPEPAHREAFVRLRKAQVVFPDIRAVYVALATHIEQQHIETTGAPREVYFADFFAAGPDDEVCDVAFPIR